MHRGRRILIFGIISVLIVVADQVTKYLIVAWLPVNSGLTVIPGFLDIIHVRNTGAAFGIGADSAWTFRGGFFILMSFAVLAVIVWMLISGPAVDTLLVTTYALFCGGAVGNLVDRLRFGAVVDFIDVHWGDLHWPAFNVADSALCVGVALFFVHFLLAKDTVRVDTVSHGEK
ncbi:MAG: signal peptidase II [Desulfomonile tiedjei]|nr:signal peptidase II [Desulfomonile tiedjei]